jgi:DNA repair exonuclease SbcCD ATPase subunit
MGKGEEAAKIKNDNISVGFQALWDSSGDKSVLEAVKKVAEEIDKVLAGAVNFTKSFQVAEKLAASFDNIAKASSKVAEVAKKSKKSLIDQEESVESLIQRYRELNTELSKNRPSTPFHVGQEIKGRIEALNLLDRALKQQPGDKGLVSEYTRQSQALQRCRIEMKALNGETQALKQATSGVLQDYKKYFDQIKRINVELKRWGDTGLGDEGVRRQIDLYKQKQAVYRQAADEGAISEKRSAELIDNISKKIQALTALKRKDAAEDKKNSQERKASLSAEEKELEKLVQTYDRLKTKMGNLGDSGQDLKIRARLEQDLRRNIENRIAAGDKSSAELREELQNLNKTKVTVDELVTSYQRLRSTLMAPLSTKTPLAGINQELLRIDAAMKQLEQIRKATGGTGGSINANGEEQFLRERKQILLDRQKQLNKEVVAENEVQRKTTAEIEKQNQLLQRQQAQLAQLQKVAKDADKMGGISGANLELDSLKKQKLLLDQMRKSGTMNTEEYAQGFQSVDQAITQVTKRLRDLQKAEASSGDKTAAETAKKREAIQALEAEYIRLGNTILKLGNTSGSLIIKEELLNKQMGIAKKLIIDYDHNVKQLEKSLGRLGQEHTKVGAKVQDTNHRWGRAFVDLLKWQ